MTSLQVDSNPNLKTKLIEQDVLQESQLQPVYLTRVEVNGGEDFSYQFFNKLLSPLLTTGDYTLSELTSRIGQSSQHLKDTGVFKDVGVVLEPDYYSNVPANITRFNRELSIPAKVIFDVSNVNLNTNQSFFNFNSEEYINLKVNHIDNNFNENAELVAVGVDYNPYKPYDYLLTNLKFISGLKDPRFKFVFDVGHNTRDNLGWQNFFKQNQLGGKIGLLYKTQREFDIFTGFQLLKRNLFDIDDGAHDDLKFFGGDFLKLSVLNKFKYESIGYLNHATKNFPINGGRIQTESELSSVQEQSNASSRGEFIKSKVGFDLYKSIFNNYITTKFQGELGGIFTLNSKFPIHPLDKFYLGGYNSFAGFKKNSIEQQGGLQFYKLQATLYTKIPQFLYLPKLNAENSELLVESNPLRLYATGIVGNCIPTQKNFFWNDANPAVSYGFGLKYFNRWANFDIGYYVSQKVGIDNFDGVKNGLHFAVSIGASSS
ncbi:hypothetical protein KGF57_003074 [Candida theae]|uniref:Bacterial surface antigen (D15) domain-containing protein n=1 Tax=Candida theae TaxID=1198502 RepID=A0AAD5BDZ4_9ASCO|nr:uncharacterized protein KGF57_003074 [Candida theae]KAI5957807.1 hypothetical protein KGF57_003074 [Candida theae]